MKKTIYQFNSISEVQPPIYLKEAVLRRISVVRVAKIRRQKRLFVAGFAATGISFLAASFLFGYQLMSSDFWNIVALGFTDGQAMLAHWQEFGISLLETFPALAVVGILLPVLVFMVLLKQYAKEQHLGDLKLKTI